MTIEEAKRILRISNLTTINKVQLKSIYRQQALENHPDRFVDPLNKLAATKRFQEINEAYNLIRATLPDAAPTAPDFRTSPRASSADSIQTPTTKSEDPMLLYVGGFIEDYISRKLSEVDKYRYGGFISWPIRILLLPIGTLLFPSMLIWMLLHGLSVGMVWITHLIVGSLHNNRSPYSAWKVFTSPVRIGLILTYLLFSLYGTPNGQAFFYLYLPMAIFELTGMLFYLLVKEKIQRLVLEYNQED